ncbi:MAG: glycosyltransferase [Chitinophagaceae bacterium]
MHYIFEMDADFSHNPKDLIRLYNACKNEGGDVAVGSRYVQGGSIENWPIDRHIYSRGGAIYTQINYMDACKRSYSWFCLLQQQSIREH